MAWKCEECGHYLTNWESIEGKCGFCNSRKIVYEDLGWS